MDSAHRTVYTIAGSPDWHTATDRFQCNRSEVSGAPRVLHGTGFQDPRRVSIDPTGVFALVSDQHRVRRVSVLSDPYDNRPNTVIYDAGAGTFHDLDDDEEEISGMLQFSAYPDEEAIDGYVVSFGRNGFAPDHFGVEGHSGVSHRQFPL